MTTLPDIRRFWRRSIGCQGVDGYRLVLPRALDAGITAVAVKEIVYQAKKRIQNKEDLKTPYCLFLSDRACNITVWFFVFIRRDFLTYLLLKSEFVFLDYGEPAFLFYFDYLALMGVCIFASHYLSKLLKNDLIYQSDAPGKKHFMERVESRNADSLFSHIAVEVPGENTGNEWLEPVETAAYEKLERING